MTLAYYCLIQYCPDFSRAETANVGLLLFRPQPPAVAVRVVEDVRPVVKRLGQKTDLATLLGSVRSMAQRIEYERFQSLEAVEQFARTRGNQIQLTMPRPMRSEDLMRDLETTFAELVDLSKSAKAATKQSERSV